MRKLLVSLVLCVIASCGSLMPVYAGQGIASPYSLAQFKAQLFTYSGQTGSTLQFNQLSTNSSLVGCSYASGTVDFVGSSLSTATFTLYLSYNNGQTFVATPLTPQNNPGATPATTVTITAPETVYTFNPGSACQGYLATSATFTATNVSAQITLSPNAIAGARGAGSTSGPVTAFNGRTGAVAPQTGDYSFAQISGSPSAAQVGGAGTIPNNTSGTAANSTAVGGVSISGSPMPGQVPVASSPTAAGWGNPSAAGVNSINSTTGPFTMQDGNSTNDVVCVTTACNFPTLTNVANYAGADLGAKINAADAALSGIPSTLVVTAAAGYTLSTAVSLSANHTLYFESPGTYNASAPITLGATYASVKMDAGVIVKNVQTGGSITSVFLVTSSYNTISGDGIIDNNNQTLTGYGTGVIHLTSATAAAIRNIRIVNAPVNSTNTQALTIESSTGVSLENVDFDINSLTSIFPTRTSSSSLTSSNIKIVGGSLGNLSLVSLSGSSGPAIGIYNVSISGTHFHATGVQHVIGGGTCVAVQDASAGGNVGIDQFNWIGGSCTITGTTSGTSAFGFASMPTNNNTNFVISGVTFTSYGQYLQNTAVLELGVNGGSFSNNTVTMTPVSGANLSCIVQYGKSFTIANNYFNGCAAGNGNGISLYEQYSFSHTAYNSDNNSFLGNTVISGTTTGYCGFLYAAVTGGSMLNTTFNDNKCIGTFAKGAEFDTNNSNASVTAYNNHFWGTMSVGIGVGVTGGTPTYNVTIGTQDFGSSVTTPFTNFTPSLLTLLPTTQISPPYGITGLNLIATTLNSGSHTIGVTDGVIYATGGTTIVFPGTCPAAIAGQWFVVDLINNSTTTTVTFTARQNNIPTFLPQYTSMMVGCQQSGTWWMLSATANSAILSAFDQYTALQAGGGTPAISYSGSGTATIVGSSRNTAGVVTIATAGTTTFTLTWALDGQFSGYTNRAICTIHDETVKANEASLQVGTQNSTTSTFTITTTLATEHLTYECPAGV